MSDFVCWKCGGSLKALELPYSRRDECPHCHAELHVCRLCKHYAPRLTSLCNHDYTDPPRDRDRANFCDYFKPRKNAYQKLDARQSDLSRNQLSELFGEKVINDVSRDRYQDPFEESKAAHEKLNALFNDEDTSAE